MNHETTERHLYAVSEKLRLETVKNQSLEARIRNIVSCRQVTIPACCQRQGNRVMTVTLPWRCVYCGDERMLPLASLPYWLSESGRQRVLREATYIK